MAQQQVQIRLVDRINGRTLHHARISGPRKVYVNKGATYRICLSWINQEELSQLATPPELTVRLWLKLDRDEDAVSARTDDQNTTLMSIYTPEQFTQQFEGPQLEVNWTPEVGLDGYLKVTFNQASSRYGNRTQEENDVGLFLLRVRVTQGDNVLANVVGRIQVFSSDDGAGQAHRKDARHLQPRPPPLPYWGEVYYLEPISLEEEE